MKMNIWIVGFLVLAAVVSQITAVGITDLDMNKCGINHDAFMNIASLAPGCDDLKPTPERQIDEQTLKAMLEAIQHKMACFGLASGYVDVKTGSTNVTKFEEAVLKVATTVEKGTAIITAFSDCNEQNLTILDMSEGQKVYVCFMPKFFTSLCELN